MNHQDQRFMKEELWDMTCDVISTSVLWLMILHINVMLREQMLENITDLIHTDLIERI